MFDYQTSKHARFDAACRIFAIEHNLEDVAAAIGTQTAEKAGQTRSKYQKIIA